MSGAGEASQGPLASPAVVPDGFTIRSLAGVAAGFSQAHTIWRQEAWAADVC
jgi:hypothetical protein